MSTETRTRRRLRRGGSRRDAATPPAAPAVGALVTAGEAVPLDGDAAPADILAGAQAQEGSYGVIVYPSPDADAVAELARSWDLHPLLAEDLQHARQRPKLERYGDVIFVVARAAWYIDEAEAVELAELHLVIRPGAVAILCQDGRWADGADLGAGAGGALARLLDGASLLGCGPEAVAYRLLDMVVDGYGPVLEGLAIDKEQIERQVFSGDAAAAERIYRLSREVIDLAHACTRLSTAVTGLTRDVASDAVAGELRTYLGDVSDHLARAEAEVTELRDALTQILEVNSTLVAQRQNEDMKKISGWAAILFAPTLVAAVYGMNFDRMPELHWAFGYPVALGLMAAFSVVLYLVFKRGRWM